MPEKTGARGTVEYQDGFARQVSVLVVGQHPSVLQLDAIPEKLSSWQTFKKLPPTQM